MHKAYRIYTGLLVLAVLLTFFSLFVTAGTYLLTHNPMAMDFLAFYTGANLLAHLPNELYNLHTQHNMQQLLLPSSRFIAYVNPPFVALFFVPFIKLGLLNAYIGWTFINTLLLLTICYLGFLQMQTQKWLFKLLVVIGTITFIPALTTILIGQLSLLLALIFLITWIFLKKGWEFRSGLVLSLLLIKPQFLILPFIAVLLQRRMKLTAGLLTGIIILIAISYFLVGTNGLLNFLQTINAAYDGDLRYDPDLMAQHSLQTALLILFQTQKLSTIFIQWLLSISVIVLPTLFVWTQKVSLRSHNFAFQFSILIFATLVTSPHTHFHDLTIFLSAAIILFSVVKNVNKKKQTKLIAFLISGYVFSLLGFFLEVMTRSATNSLWILLDVCYLVTFWGYLLKTNIKSTDR